MSNERDDHHSPVGNLKQQWEDEEAERNKLEWQARKLFLEEQANEIFAPIENYLTRLHKVLQAFGASVEVSDVWEHIDDQKLRRVAKVNSTQPVQQLLLDFIIQGASISYRDRSYQLSHNTEALMRVIS